MFRLMNSGHKHMLGAVPVPSRFGDPEMRYAILYASETVRCGFCEALIRNRFTRRKHRELPSSDVESMLVVSLCSIEQLTLVDLRGDGATRIAAPAAVVHDSNHTAGRALSAATYISVPEADGIMFQSRFTGDAYIAIFDRAICKLTLLEVMPLIEHSDFLHALTDYDITLTTSPD